MALRCNKVEKDYKFLSKIISDSYKVETAKRHSPFFISKNITPYTKAHLLSGHELVPVMYHNFYLNDPTNRQTLDDSIDDGYQKVAYCKLCSTGYNKQAMVMSSSVFSKGNFYKIVDMPKCFDDDLIVLHTQELNRFYGLQIITTKTHYNQEAIFYNKDILRKMFEITKDNPKMSFIHTGLNGSVPTHFHCHATIYRYQVAVESPTISEMNMIVKNMIYYKIVERGAQKHIVIKVKANEKGLDNLYKLLNSLYQVYQEHKVNISDLKTREYFFIDKDKYFTINVIFDMKSVTGPVYKRGIVEFWYDPSVMSFVASNIGSVENFEELDRDILVDAVKKRVYVDIYDDIDLVLEKYHNFQEYTVDTVVISDEYDDEKMMKKLFKEISVTKGFPMSDEYKKYITSILYYKGIDWIRKNMDELLVFEVVYRFFTEHLGYESGIPVSYGKLNEITNSFGDNINIICTLDKKNKVIVKNKNIQGYKVFLKSYQNNNKNEAIKEYKIRKEINNFRIVVPHFEYTHGLYNKGNNYFTIIENITNDDIINLSDVIRDLKYVEMLSILFQIIVSIYLANEMSGFVHGDLNVDSIKLLKLSDNIDNWSYGIDGNKYNIKLYGYSVYITNFKKSSISAGNSNKNDDISNILDSIIRNYYISYNINFMINFWLDIRDKKKSSVMLLDYIIDDIEGSTKNIYKWGDVEGSYRVKIKNNLMESKRILSQQLGD